MAKKTDTPTAEKAVKKKESTETKDIKDVQEVKAAKEEETPKKTDTPTATVEDKDLQKENDKLKAELDAIKAKLETDKEPEPKKEVKEKESKGVWAVKGGIRRFFPLLAWRNMPRNKGGWKEEVKAPAEARK